MTCVWVDTARGLDDYACVSSAAHAYLAVYVRIKGFACMGAPKISDHFTRNNPFSLFFSEVVCVLGVSPSGRPLDGNWCHAGVTRRRHRRSSHGVKPHTSLAVGCRSIRRRCPGAKEIAAEDPSKITMSWPPLARRLSAGCVPGSPWWRLPARAVDDPLGRALPGRSVRLQEHDAVGRSGGEADLASP